MTKKFSYKIVLEDSLDYNTIQGEIMALDISVAISMILVRYNLNRIVSIFIEELKISSYLRGLSEDGPKGIPVPMFH